VSCPSCARQGFDVIRTVQALEERLQHIRTPMSLSVLGCVVNGPGEARETDIGITGGGNGKHMVYLSGVTDHHVQDADMIDHIVKLVEAKAAEIEAAESAAAQAAECAWRVQRSAVAVDRGRGSDAADLPRHAPPLAQS
jgi:(E)-4-hydroxy-3-methylbut-2-enyl-diphosphate synthase